MTDSDLLGLNKYERELIDTAHAGTTLMCDDENLTIRASLLRELLLSRRGHLDPHGVRIYGAHISGPVDLSHIRAPVGLALFCCHVDETIQLDGAHLPWLALRDTTITTLFAHGLRVEGSINLDKGFNATARGDDAAVALRGAEIRGSLNLSGAVLHSELGPALDADSIRVAGDVLLSDEFTATTESPLGGVRLPGATITGDLTASGARLTNSAGPALHVAGITASSLFLDQGFSADGHGDLGTLRLISANLRGSLRLDTARVRNSAGPAVGADRLRVEENVNMDGLSSTASSTFGSIRMVNAHIGGQFGAHKTHLANDNGPALAAQGLHVDGDMLLQDGFTAHGTNESTVDLAGAKIGGQLGLRGANLINPTGPVLSIAHAQAETAWIPMAVLNPACIKESSPCEGEPKLRTDGFTYTGLREIGWQDWLHLLRHHTGGYRSQPYQQLATVEKTSGHDGAVRRILIAQQDDLRERGQMITPAAALVHRAWGILAGYGYRAGRLAVALAVVLALAGALGWLAGHLNSSPGHPAAERTAASGHPGTPCSTIEQVGLGIDRGLPLATTGIRNHCDLNSTSHTGQLLTLSLWLLQASIWALATLALAGYTGLIRKTT